MYPEKSTRLSRLLPTRVLFLIALVITAAFVAAPAAWAVDVTCTGVMGGGASGPLYGSFFLAAGEALSHDKQLPDDLAEIFASGVDAVSRRGRSQAGEKTMLDVLVPVLETLKTDAGRPDLVERIRTRAAEAAARTAPMQATKGRASYLGPRSVGHVDPGARSSCVLLHAVCASLEGRQ